MMMTRLPSVQFTGVATLCASVSCNPAFDALLAKARGVTDVAQRQALYRQVVDVYLRDRPHIVLYHAKWLWALSDRVLGFVPAPDGLIRPQGMAVAP